MRIKQNPKREALINAFADLAIEKGFLMIDTTLAEVAQRANVPLGNVHYYFKAKHELADVSISRILNRLFEEEKDAVEFKKLKLERLLADIKLFDFEAEDNHG